MWGEMGYAGVLMLASGSAIVLHALYLSRQRRWMALDPLNLFWVGAIMVYFLESLGQGGVLVQRHGAGLFSQTWLWIFVGCLGVICGYESRVGVRLGLGFPRFAPKLNPDRMQWIGTFLVMLGVGGYLYAFSYAGGMAKWAATARGGPVSEEAFAPLLGMSGLLPLGVAVLLFHVHLHPVSPARRMVVWLVAAGLLLWNLYMGSRSGTIMLCVAAASALYLPRRRSPSMILMALLFLALYGVTNFQQHYREYFRNFSFNLDKIDFQEAKGVMFPEIFRNEETRKDDFAPGTELNVVICTIRYVPNEVKYTYGYGYLQVFTTLIPRKFWPGKPYPSVEAHQGVLQRLGGKYNALVRGTRFIMGPAFTFVGHWYYIGGPVVLILASLYTGGLFRMLRTIYDRSPGSESDIIIYGKYLVIGFSEAAATPSTWLYDYYTPFGLVLLIWLAREKSP
jgi:hypothetical protein